jgi:hypothetical protein
MCPSSGQGVELSVAIMTMMNRMRANLCSEAGD